MPGWDGGPQYLSTVEINDPLSDSWKLGSELPVTLSSAQVINHQDNLYVLGGWLPDFQPNNMVFTLIGGEWQVLTGVTVEVGGRSGFPPPILNRTVLFCASNNK